MIYFNINTSVEFQNNKVRWDLYTLDVNSNNRSEQSVVIPQPDESWMDWGEHLFVNPIWSTHDTDWNDAIEDVEDNNSSTLVSQSIGEGNFAFQIQIEMEDLVLNLNGTRTFTYSSSYDDDGVMLSLEFTILTNWFNENTTYDVTYGYQQSRVGGLPAGGGFDLSMGVPLYAALAIIPVFLIVGILLGKRKWG